MILYVDRLLSNRLNVSKNLNYSVCAANDCQDGDITSANLEQYTPAYDATRYIVVSIFSLFVCTAMILHFCFLPHDKPVHNSSPITLKNGHQQDDAAIELVHQCHDNKGACDVKVTLDNNKVLVWFLYYRCYMCMSLAKNDMLFFFEPSHFTKQAE